MKKKKKRKADGREVQLEGEAQGGREVQLEGEEEQAGEEDPEVRQEEEQSQ